MSNKIKFEKNILSFLVGFLLAICFMNGIDKYPTDLEYDMLCFSVDGYLISYDWDHIECSNGVYIEGKTSFSSSN